MALQLDFIYDEGKTEFYFLKEDVREVRASCDKVRRGIYAKHNILQKKYDELLERMNIIEKHICRNPWRN